MSDPRGLFCTTLSARLHVIDGACTALRTLSAAVARCAAPAARLTDEMTTANVIAGQAKALLAGTPYHFAFSTPSVMTGADREIWPRPGSECLVIAFDSDVGEVVLRLFQDL